MNLNDTSTQLLYTTIPVYAVKANGNVSTGTGFIFSWDQDKTSIPFLVTNYHVVAESENGILEFHYAGDNGEPAGEVLDIHFDKSAVDSNKLGDLDLVAIPLAGTINELANKGVHIFYRSIAQTLILDKGGENKLAALEEVTFIGYPENLIDDEHKLPIIRRGITATPIWNDFKGKNEFLIDANVFPGSSGSPVFIYNKGSYATDNRITFGSRLVFVGIIRGTIQETKGFKDYLNLGVVINARSFFKELEKHIHKLE